MKRRLLIFVLSLFLMAGCAGMNAGGNKKLIDGDPSKMDYSTAAMHSMLVQLDADANGAIDRGKGGTNTTTAAGEQAALSIDHLFTLSGRPEGSNDLGTGFTGTTIPDSSTIVAALQAIEIAVELKQTAHANLTALAGLTPTANRFIYWGAGPTMGLATADTIAGLISAGAYPDSSVTAPDINYDTDDFENNGGQFRLVAEILHSDAAGDVTGRQTHVYLAGAPQSSEPANIQIGDIVTCTIASWNPGGLSGSNNYEIRITGLSPTTFTVLEDFAGNSYFNEIYHKTWSFDPVAVCDGDVDRLLLMTVGDDTPDGLTVSRWKVSFEADPTTEVDLDLKRADAFIGVANSAVMDVLDTANGESGELTEANINSGNAVALGKVIYLEFGTAYTETGHQIIFEMWYHK